MAAVRKMRQMSPGVWSLCLFLLLQVRESQPLRFWSPRAVPPLPYTGLIVPSPAEDQTVYATGEDVPRVSALYRSVDAGASWVQITQAPAGEQVASFAIDPANPLWMLLTTFHSNTGTAVVYRSADGGATWKEALDPMASCGPISFARGGAVGLVGCGAQLFRTLDLGHSWSSSLNPTNSRQFAPSPDGSIFAVGSGESILQSSDDGDSWTVVGFAPTQCPYVNWLAISPSNPQELLAGTGESIHFGLLCGGIFRSADGGATWEETLADRGVSQIVFDANSPSRVFAGADGSGLVSNFPLIGVFQSDDGGRTWTDLPLPEDSVDGVGIALSASGRALYAHVIAGGLYEHRFRRPTLLDAR